MGRVITQTSSGLEEADGADGKREQRRRSPFVVQDRDLLLFWQDSLETRVLNVESGIFHCGSAALRDPSRGGTYFGGCLTIFCFLPSAFCLLLS